MRSFALFLIASLLVFGLVLFCHRHDIGNMQQDYQAYQKRNMLEGIE